MVNKLAALDDYSASPRFDIIWRFILQEDIVYIPHLQLARIVALSVTKHYVLGAGNYYRTFINRYPQGSAETRNVTLIP